MALFQRIKGKQVIDAYYNKKFIELATELQETRKEYAQEILGAEKSPINLPHDTSAILNRIEDSINNPSKVTYKLTLRLVKA